MTAPYALQWLQYVHLPVVHHQTVVCNNCGKKLQQVIKLASYIAMYVAIVIISHTTDRPIEHTRVFHMACSL